MFLCDLHCIHLPHNTYVTSPSVFWYYCKILKDKRRKKARVGVGVYVKSSKRNYLVFRNNYREWIYINERKPKAIKESYVCLFYVFKSSKSNSHNGIDPFNYLSRKTSSHH